MFDHLLIPLDGSKLAECVLPHALAFANAFHSRCTLFHVLVAERGTQRHPSFDPVEWKLQRAEMERYLEAIQEQLQQAGLDVHSMILEGDPSHQIVRQAHSEPGTLLVLSSHGLSGLASWSISSVVQKILQEIRVSVLLIRAQHGQQESASEALYQKLLVPLDGSQRSEIVLQAAAQLSLTHQAKLHLIHIVNPPVWMRRTPPSSEERLLSDKLVNHQYRAAESYFEDLRLRLPMDFELHLNVSGDVAGSLNQIAKEDEIDLLMLSAQGFSSAPDRPLGSVSASMIQYGNHHTLLYQDLPPYQPDRERYTTDFQGRQP